METRFPRGGGRRRAGAPGGAALRARPGCGCRRGAPAPGGGCPGLRGGGGWRPRAGKRRGAALGGRGRPRGGGAASSEHPLLFQPLPQVGAPWWGQGRCGGVSVLWRSGVGGVAVVPEVLPACRWRREGGMRRNLACVIYLLVLIITEYFLLVTFCRSLLIVTLIMMHFPAFLGLYS